METHLEEPPDGSGESWRERAAETRAARLPSNVGALRLTSEEERERREVVPAFERHRPHDLAPCNYALMDL